MPSRYSKPVYGHELPWWAYDLAISAGCALFAWAALAWSKLALLPLAVLLYGSFVEPRLLRVTRYEVGKGSRALRIAFLSDIHVGPYKGKRWVEKLVRRTRALAPDMILLAGDFLPESAKDLPLLAPLKALRAPYGVHAILGNHDEYKAAAEARAWFEREGFSLLLNRSVRAGEGVSAAGADDDWYVGADLDAAFRDLPSDGLAVVLLHNPDLAPHAAGLLTKRSGPSVMLAGHTHGGQIRLPLVGSVPALPHHLGRAYDRGLFAFEGVPLVIGTGAGESGPRARLFCPPEIALVTVRY